MKIAIDAGPLKSGHKIRGIGVHTRELILALSQEVRKAGLDNVKIEAVDFGRANLSKYDVVHYQYFNPFLLTLPDKKITKTVITIHDLIPLIYPERYPSGTKGKLRFSAQKRRLKNVDAIITISETSKKDICRFLGVRPDKVHVIPLAPRKTFKKMTDDRLLTTVKNKYNLPDKFALFVGDVNYNKNIPTLIEACKLAKLPLVICGKQALDIEGLGIGDIMTLQGPRDWIRFLFGKPHPELAHYEEVLSEFKKSKNIFRLGFVPDHDLVPIYNSASIYVQASFYEGFGLPVLEAQASGCPVVASKIQAHVEIAENSALFADPKSSEDFAKKIRRVIKGEKFRNKLVQKGFQNVQNYSWAKTAKATLKVYESL